MTSQEESNVRDPIVSALRNPNTEEIAFEQLFKEEYPLLVKQAHWLIGDYNLAKDIGQDVFRVLWQKKPYLTEEIGSMRSYLFKSCHNRCLNEMKAQHAGAERDHVIKYFIPTAVKPASDPGDALRYIKLLPTQQGHVVRLVLLDGYTTEEAGKIMGISKYTVREHLQRGKKLLARLLRNG
ncbi:RNA polymerase sigma-70 factor (ECF subfamily) [Chitinophaga terrae (ex Kim and Jung 2007)]|uniref:RNA polymerase sigma factor n=1 Tax=Chitinophaga terrae (ex Kim and Jung 2007) TaxID=408074 RepID=UPI0027818F9B|nr:sigma-70 family RNA polymerase sigma factor [Chitinophaga terrae (ex Kim and Jung 2007)]MDQ0107503.1 RNA polymerase sigma-70 factor (ECF subfamily) [Chitinophaga terrae (ex Kim and Jung 2007)]